MLDDFSVGYTVGRIPGQESMHMNQIQEEFTIRKMIRGECYDGRLLVSFHSELLIRREDGSVETYKGWVVETDRELTEEETILLDVFELERFYV